MMTISEHVERQQRAFRRLSSSRQRTLAREAEQLVRQQPHMADASTYWRGLSARQVLEAYHSE